MAQVFQKIIIRDPGQIRKKGPLAKGISRGQVGRLIAKSKNGRIKNEKSQGIDRQSEKEKEARKMKIVRG